ncbi:MAG: hypothetical protein KME45_20780 [Stenomitos rutilans HA7619-LM2]|nr:hypothetical protein [Stenomitos rutilans HA7619-LM2]
MFKPWGDGFPPRSQHPTVVLFHYDRSKQARGYVMQIGRFFSLQQGRVGQYLAPRVLVVRSPFRAFSPTVCYFGFDHLKQAQTFAQKLASIGASFQIRRSRIMPQAYEIRLRGHSDLARTLAYWERQSDRTRRSSNSQTPSHQRIERSAIAA